MTAPASHSHTLCGADKFYQADNQVVMSHRKLSLGRRITESVSLLLLVYTSFKATDLRELLLSFEMRVLKWVPEPGLSM